MEIKGIRRFERNLQAALHGFETVSYEALSEAAEIVKKDTDATNPLVPVDSGDLRRSFFIAHKKGVRYAESSFSGRNAEKLSSERASRIEKEVSRSRESEPPLVVLGYTAFYALPLHENLETKYWTRRGSGAKWFQYALTRNIGRMVNKIGQVMKRNEKEVQKAVKGGSI